MRTSTVNERQRPQPALPGPSKDHGSEPASSLPAFFHRIAQLDREFVVYDDGWRGRSYSYADLSRMAEAFAARLLAHDIRKGDHILICSESRPGYIATAIQTGKGPEPKPASSVTDLLQRYAPGRTISPDMTLEELGLSSLDRVELMLDIEEKLDISIDDSTLSSASKVSDLIQPAEAAKPIPEPTYNRTWIARLVRRVLLPTIFFPLTRFFARLTISGREHLDGIKGPVIFAANHQSYIDPAVVLISLTNPWRYRIAPAMWMEYFDAHFSPDRYPFFKRLGNSILYRLLTLLFNAFPLSQMETGTRHTLRYIGELVEEGWSILIFPEGERTMTGEIGRFYPGVAMIASRMGLPVVPIHLIGLDKVWHRNSGKLRPGVVEVRIGSPMVLKGDSYQAMAKQLEDAVRLL